MIASGIEADMCRLGSARRASKVSPRLRTAVNASRRVPGDRSRLPFGSPSLVSQRLIVSTNAAAPASSPAAGKAADGSGAAGLKTWKCAIHSSDPLQDDNGTQLEIVIVDIDSETRSAPISVDAWRPPKVETNTDGQKGWVREGPVTLPASIKNPGAVLLRKLPGKNGAPAVDYISSIKLVSPTAVSYMPAHSYVSSDQGWRTFFTGTAYLPKDTPQALRDDRERELAAIQGTAETRMQTRKGGDRIYWYQVYDDLSSGKSGDLVRPNLGNSKELPYPRRLATNRGTEPDGREKGVPEGDKYWLPFDEQFSVYKNKDFVGDAVFSVLPKVFAIIAESGNNQDMKLGNVLSTVVKGKLNQVASKLTGKEANIDNYEDFNDALAMFKRDADKSFDSLKPTALYPKSSANGAPSAAAAPPAESAFKRADGAWDFTVSEDIAVEVNKSIAADARAGPLASVAGMAAKLGGKVAEKLKGGVENINDLLYFPVPKVLDGRPDAWYTDEEYGRQMLAGFNPCVITALKALPESFGSAVRGEHVNAELQGATLEQLVSEAAGGAKPRLFYVDYWDLSAFWEDAEAKGVKTNGMVQHAGRAFFYLRKDAAGNDDALLPIAIELASPGLHKERKDLPRSAGVVYARSALANDPQTLAVWRLAKFMFRSLDSAFHQLVSHWTRTHACIEPFLIAMKRQISVMHPVYKLMIPHFRYTLQINNNARQRLINAGGTIEGNFSAGPYALRLASAVYGKYWTFAGQALPADLKRRGLVDANNKPWMHFPYADDGLSVWQNLTAYFSQYLHHYYKSDDDVANDPELQAWWAEVKSEGHPDLVKFGLRKEAEVWGFTGPIPTVARLNHVLCTIAYISSAHHAAVNFGQYDFSSLTLNVSSAIRKPMPVPGDKAYKELVGAAAGPAQERIIMTYLAGPQTAAKIAATVKLLSSHANDEHTLDEPNEYLVDPDAKRFNRNFINNMKALEDEIERRNADPANWARNGLLSGKAAPLPYTLLMPSSGAGVTMRGVPYSISI